MIIKPGFVAKETNGVETVCATGKAADKFDGYIPLSGHAKLLWEALSKGATKDELVSLMLATYDIERESAENDVKAFLNLLAEADIIDEEESDIPDEDEQD